MDESYAVFEADDNGNIDLSRQAPVEGCYSGINSMLWHRMLTESNYKDIESKYTRNEYYRASNY